MLCTPHHEKFCFETRGGIRKAFKRVGLFKIYTMKKLSNLKSFLSRQEMKEIHGGDFSGDGEGTDSYCYCNNGGRWVADCSWCNSVCAIRGGYKGVCLSF